MTSVTIYAIRVVFVTADGRTNRVVTGFEAGGVDYISKPICEEELLMRVRTHLRIRYLARELADKNRQLEEEISLRKPMEWRALREKTLAIE